MFKTHRLTDQILQKADEVQGLYYRLVLVVCTGENGGSTTFTHLVEPANVSVINVNLELSRQLLPLTTRQRPLRVASLLSDMVTAVDNEIVLLTHINLLFDPTLQQDPLRLLQNLSRRKTITALWEGQIQGQYLTYARPDHPEYRRYSTRELILIHSLETS
jgi:hypothetical protein